MADDKSKNENKPLPIAKICVFALMLIGITLIFVFGKELSPDNVADKANYSDSKKDEAKTDISGSIVHEKNFCSTKSGLMFISDTTIVGLNHDCEKTFSEKHSYTSPMIKSSEMYSITFGEGSSGFKIIKDGHKIYEGVQGKSIVDCDINDLGSYGILSDQTGYLSCLTVYDKDNQFVYSYSFSDYYAVALSISDDGKRVAVGAINSLNGRLVSVVYLLDLTKKEPLNKFTYENQIIYDVEFISQDNFVVITDGLTTVISGNGSKETPYSYSSQILTAYDICYDSGVVLSLSKSDDGRNCNIVSLNKDGNEIGSFATNLKVMSLDTLSDRMAILSYGKLEIFNSYGDMLNSFDVGTDTKAVVMPYKKMAYVLGVSDIKKVSIK